MPALRRDDPARKGDPRDRRPVAPSIVEPRNGIPERHRPYMYRGTERGGSIPRLPTAGLSTTPPPSAPVWRLSSQALLDVCEAIDGPTWFDWREWHDMDGAA